MYRLVVEAGANRDFNAIHHNSEFAQASGAPEMYANTTFLLGMWERAVREFIGLEGRIVGIKGFRMTSFNVVGQTVTVQGRVAAQARGRRRRAGRARGVVGERGRRVGRARAPSRCRYRRRG